MADYTIKLNVDGKPYTVKWKGSQPTRQDVAKLEARIRSNNVTESAKSVGAAIGGLGSAPQVAKDIPADVVPRVKGKPGAPYQNVPPKAPVKDYAERGAYGGVKGKVQPGRYAGTTDSNVGADPKAEQEGRRAVAARKEIVPGAGPLDPVFWAYQMADDAVNAIPGVKAGRTAAGGLAKTGAESVLEFISNNLVPIQPDTRRRIAEAIGGTTEDLTNPVNWGLGGAAVKAARNKVASNAAKFMDDAKFVEPPKQPATQSGSFKITIKTVEDPELVQQVYNSKQRNPGMGSGAIAQELGVSRDRVADALLDIEAQLGRNRLDEYAAKGIAASDEALNEAASDIANQLKNATGDFHNGAIDFETLQARLAKLRGEAEAIKAEQVRRSGQAAPKPPDPPPKQNVVPTGAGAEKVTGTKELWEKTRGEAGIGPIRGVDTQAIPKKGDTVVHATPNENIVGVVQGKAKNGAWLVKTDEGVIETFRPLAVVKDPEAVAKIKSAFEHNKSVKDAVDGGKPVPESVLREHFEWAKTKAEYTQDGGRAYDHDLIVETALKEGKPVPAGVLADYPDLAAKYPQKPVAKSPTKAPVAPTPKPPETVATHNASKQVRQELDLPEYTKSGKKVDEIVAEANKNPNLADEALVSMEKKPRPLTDAETVALDQRGAKLLAKRRKLVNDIAHGKSQGKDVSAKEAVLAETDEMLNRVLDASDKGGSELGRALGLRAKLAKDKYTPEGMVKEAQAASPKPLDSDQFTKAEELGKRVTELEQKLADLQKSVLANDADKQVSVILKSRVKSAAKGELNVKVTKEQAEQAWKDLLAPTELGAGLGSMGRQGQALVKIATHYVERAELTAVEIFNLIKSKAGHVDDLAIWEAIRVGAGDVGRNVNKGRSFGDDVLISGKAGIQNKDIQAARIALDKAKRDADEFIGSLTPAKPGDIALDIVNIPRTLMASADVSAWFRQGAVLATSHPIIGVKAMGKSIKPIFSEKAALEIDDIIRNADPAAHKIREQAGLYIAPLNNAKILKREETFISKTVNKIPGIGHVTRASERTYISYLNKLRADVFDAFVKGNPGATADELADYADFINKATGRGSLGDFERASAKIANWLFSPRFLVSRIQTPAKLFTSKGLARKQILKDFTAYSGVVASTLYVAHLAGAEVNLNPQSSDFLKIRVGKLVVDVGAGFTQAYRMTARMILSAYNKAEGKEAEAPLDIAGDFGKYKLSPQVTLTNTIVSGKNMIGEKKTPLQAIGDSLVPLSAQEAKEIIDEYPGGKGAALAILNFIGFGTSVYDKKSDKPKKPNAPTKPKKP